MRARRNHGETIACEYATHRTVALACAAGEVGPHGSALPSAGGGSCGGGARLGHTEPRFDGAPLNLAAANLDLAAAELSSS